MRAFQYVGLGGAAFLIVFFLVQATVSVDGISQKSRVLVADTNEDASREIEAQVRAKYHFGYTSAEYRAAIYRNRYLTCDIHHNCIDATAGEQVVPVQTTETGAKRDENISKPMFHSFSFLE